MIRQIAAACLFAFSVACATQTGGTAAEPASTATGVIPASSANAAAPSARQLDAAYDCVAEAIADGGYRVRRNDQRRGVIGSIRDEVGAEDSRVQGEWVGGTTSRHARTAREATPYVIDVAVASVRVDPTNGRLQVTTEAYTGAGLTARGGWIKRPASARGMSVTNQARACADIVA